MHKYIPIIKRPTIGKLFDDLASKNKTVKSSTVPYLELGHSKIEDDIKLFASMNHYDKYFADYFYSRGPKSNDDDKWNVRSNEDLITLTSKFPRSVVAGSSVFDKSKVIPVVSRPNEYDDSNELIQHYVSLIPKYRTFGFNQVGLRLEHNFKDMKNPTDQFKEAVLKLKDNDFVFIDCKTSSLSINKFEAFENSINSNVSSIKSIKKGINVAILNPEFDLKDVTDTKIKRHNHGKSLMRNKEVYGYGNYVSEREQDLNGPNPVPFSISYYDFKTGNTIRFDSKVSIKETLKLFENDEYAKGLVKEHSKYCSSCEELENCLEDPDEGDKKLRNNRRKGQIRKEHFINSIVIDEMTQGTPSTY